MIVPEPRRHYLHGYPSRRSVAPGQRVELHISTSLTGYSLTVARVGAGEQEVWRRERIAGTEHPVPADASSHGCRWPPALELTVGREWPSGYYRVALRGEAPDGRPVRGEMAFVVRSADPGRTASILLQRTTNTDNAYNRYGGSTLYYGPAGPATRVSFERPYAGFEPIGHYRYSIPKELQITTDGHTLTDEMAAALTRRGVDTDRPTFLRPAAVQGCWNLQQAEVTLGLHRQPGRVDVYDSFSSWANCWRNWEHPFVAWAERAGYRIDYAVNGDLEFHPEMLDRYRLVLSVGHDEYWSKPMRDHLEAYIGGGGNVAFLSGNCVWWQVRSEEEGRALVCFKDHTCDPHFASGEHDTLTTMWCHRLIGRPENRLTGVSFAYGGYHRFFGMMDDGPDGYRPNSVACGSAVGPSPPCVSESVGPPARAAGPTDSYTVHRPEHWAFAGTRLERGQSFGARDRIVGYECDGCQVDWRDGLPFPTHRDGTPATFRILATAPAALGRVDASLEQASRAILAEDGGTLPQPGLAVMGTYTRGGTVVTVGCTEWSNGLAGGDPAVDRITRNILDRLG